MAQKPHYVAKVTPVAGGFVGEAVEEGTGAPAGLGERSGSAEEAAAAAVGFTEALNNYDVRYDG